jgi:hypothetical protein
MMKKTEIPGVYKVQEGILVNKDTEALEKYKRRRDAKRRTERQINTLEQKVSKIDKLESDLEEIKSLLKKLVE